jgi:outer membrane protein TolC
MVVYRWCRWCGLGLIVLGIWATPDPGRADPPQGPNEGEVLPPPKRAKEIPLPPNPASLLGRQFNPIDLDSALRLAGVRNPEILLARERVTEAVALQQQAAARYLPSINVGTNVDTHAGNLQQSNGTILPVNRGAMYLGLGAYAVGAGTVNVPGLVLSGNVSETIYADLVSRQVVRQRRLDNQAVRNQVLLRVASGYLELLRAEGRRAVAVQTRDEARELARITANHAAAGQGRRADANRAATTLEEYNAQVLEAENQVLTASARLAQLLDLDPSIRLHAVDGWVVPAPIVPDPIPLAELITIALTQRPELGERQAAIRAALLALQGARLLPFSPNITLGYSAGTFGGGSNLVSAGILQPDGTTLQEHRFGNFGDRQDVDAVVYWTLQNLGLGNLAQIRLAQSKLRAEDFRRIEVLDRVRTEVASAHAAIHTRFAQIETSQRALAVSKNAFDEDLLRIRNREGLPIEVLDSLRLLAASRTSYLDALIDYNLAQFALYVALGQPPANTLARPIPASLVPPPGSAQPPTPPK